MQSSRYSKCWRADDATGVDSFLFAFSKIHRPFTVSESSPHTCSCGNAVVTVALAYDATKTTCAKCGACHCFAPSNFSWDDKVEQWEIDDYQCEDCLHSNFNISIGKSHVANNGQPRVTTWINIGTRCCRCGLLECVNDYCWPPVAAMSFDPTWICELARKTRPDLPWLADELGRCTSGTWTNACYIRFIDSSSAKQPGSPWRFREGITLIHERFGVLNLDVLANSRIGGIEFYDRLFIQTLER
jgi:hypothetical protein